MGHGDDVEFAQLMDQRAEEDGAVGLEDEVTVADDAPPIEMTSHWAKLRGAGRRARAFVQRVKLRRTVSEAPERMRQKMIGGALKKASIPVLKERLRELRADVPYLERRRDGVEDKVEEIPFYRRGLVAPAVVGSVLAAVALFDGAVMKSALDETTLGSAAVWLTTGGLALLFAAINEAFGLLLAIMIRWAGPRRFWVIAGILAIGVIGLLASIAMLGFFRAEVASSQNHSLGQLAAGHEASFNFIISPSFLAPLQGVGCFAAMAVVALYALSSEYRVLQKRLKVAEGLITQNEADIVATEGDIAEAHRSADATYLETFDIGSAAAGAQAELKVRDEEQEAADEADQAKGEELASRYRSKRNTVKRAFDNGGVRRARRPTENGRRSTHTPEEQDIEVEEKPPAESNGHHDMPDPEQIFFDMKGI
jgi:hypothetical protein